MTLDWSRATIEEKRAAVAPLAAAGMTSGAIAQQLGTTRNAILGFCWRQGIKLLHIPVDRASSAQQAAYCAMRRTRPISSPKPILLPSLPREEPPKPYPRLRGVRFTDAEHRHCRYFLDGERGANGLICAAPVHGSSSWCKAHLERVFLHGSPAWLRTRGAA